MKKFYVLLVLVTLSAAVFAQKTVKMSTMNYAEKYSYVLQNSSAKATVDTAGMSSNYLPIFGDPLAEVNAYIMTDASDNREGYWFGTNGTSTSDSASDIWAQCYVNYAPVRISGVLFWVAGKTNISASANSTVSLYVQNVLPYVAGAHGCVITTAPTFGPSPAGPVLGSGTVTISALDTAFLAFNYVPIALTPSIAGDFAICANFKNMRTNGDTAYMWCDAIGNGLALNYTQLCGDTATNYFVATSLSTLDVNMSLFAVIDDAGAGIESNGFFNGFKMSLRQNPVRETAVVDYAVENTGSVNLVVYDVKGNEVVNLNQGTQAAGQHSVSFDVNALTSGMYFVTMTSSNGGRIAKQLVIE